MTWIDEVNKLRIQLQRKPNLDELLELAKTYTMNDAEKEEQRKSWIVAELIWQYPDMTRSEAEARYNRAKMSLA